MKTKQLSAVNTVHRLLFHALLEIRSQGHEQRNKLVYHLADLFHNVVLEMEAAAQGERTYEEVLHFLEEQAKEKKCEQWFDQNVAKLSAPPKHEKTEFATYPEPSQPDGIWGRLGHKLGTISLLFS